MLTATVELGTELRHRLVPADLDPMAPLREADLARSIGRPLGQQMKDLVIELDRQIEDFWKLGKEMNRAMEGLETGRAAERLYKKYTGRRLPGSRRTKRLRKKRRRARPSIHELMHREYMHELFQRCADEALDPRAAARRRAEEIEEFRLASGRIEQFLEAERMREGVEVWLLFMRALEGGAAALGAYWAEVARMSVARRIRFERAWRDAGLRTEPRPPWCAPVDPEVLEEAELREHMDHYRSGEEGGDPADLSTSADDE